MFVFKQHGRASLHDSSLATELWLSVFYVSISHHQISFGVSLLVFICCTNTQSLSICIYSTSFCDPFVRGLVGGGLFSSCLTLSHPRSFLWIQGRRRTFPQPPVLQRRHNSALLRRSREEQRGSERPAGCRKSRGASHRRAARQNKLDATAALKRLTSFYLGGRLRSQGWLWRRRPAENRKWRHLHAHLLQ